MKYIVVSLITSSVLGSFVLGLINKGKEKDGIKFIPMLLILSASVFFTVRYLLTLLFGNLFGL